ncbi:hypothetical protein LF844_02060 [Metapseudomonas lalkuanensis]|uniref:hypothetical protein n=1 Tax=Metapseudomonas lalkuanensis TaxID=2604832 RepID=UPI001CF494C8|nr:hypothetical protein [Pseudomonas lalkuanensis]UCO98626.1 hypothetical protein LF844_02060 [Pseudomonas lalkuanensis]
MAQAASFLAFHEFHAQENPLAKNLRTRTVKISVEKPLASRPSPESTACTAHRSIIDHPPFSPLQDLVLASGSGKPVFYSQSRWNLLWTSCTDNFQGQEWRGLPMSAHFSSDINEL